MKINPFANRKHFEYWESFSWKTVLNGRTVFGALLEHKIMKSMYNVSVLNQTNEKNLKTQAAQIHIHKIEKKIIF